MSKLMDKIKKANQNKEAQILTGSELFGNKELVPTDIPVLNMALSGDPVNGGLPTGLGVIAGPSKHFKTNLMLACVSAYLRYYKDAVCIFFDSEFGSPPPYLAQFGIDTDRIFHVPITNIEQLKFDIVDQLENIERGDRVIIAIDSIGNLASKREVENAKENKTAADMTRAAQLKSLTRIITPYLSLLDIPCITVNHSYMTQDFMPKNVMSGGQGPMLAANWVFMVGRSKEKDGSDTAGYIFNIKIEKSRGVKEELKFPFTARFDSGILKYSGLLDFALASGHVTSPTKGFYTRNFVDPETGEVAQDKKWRKKEVDTSVEFWEELFDKTDFVERVREVISLGSTKMIDTGESGESEEGEAEADEQQ